MSAGGTGGKGRMTETEEERQRRARFVVIGKALQFGSTVIGALVVFLGGGIWLDRRLGTAPLLLLIGLALAFVAIGYNLYDLARSGPKSRPRPATPGVADGPKRKTWDEWEAEERAEHAKDDWDTGDESYPTNNVGRTRRQRD